LFIQLFVLLAWQVLLNKIKYKFTNMVRPEFKPCFKDYISIGNITKMWSEKFQMIWSDNRANSVETELGKIPEKRGMKIIVKIP
jgi:hypothetical protein